MSDHEEQRAGFIRRIGELRRRTPDMTAIEWADEHGWISQKEYEQALRTADEVAAGSKALAQEISAHRREDTEGWSRWLDDLIAFGDLLTGRFKRVSEAGDESRDAAFDAALLERALAGLRELRGRPGGACDPGDLWSLFTTVELRRKYEAPEDAGERRT